MAGNGWVVGVVAETNYRGGGKQMKRIFISVLLVVAALTLVGCLATPQGPSEEGAINIGVMPDVESIPFIIAEKNGYFEAQGAEVNLIHFKSAQDRDSAMQSGQLDGLITDVVAVVFANEGGLKQRIIAANDGNIEMLAGRDTGINTLTDLVNKQVGLSTNTIMEYSADKMLQSQQIDPATIHKVAIPPLPTRLEMLLEGRIDACILPDPLAALAVKNGAKVLCSTDELANKPGAIAFTERSLKDNPEAIKAIFRAYNDSVAYLEQGLNEEYLDFIIEKQGFPADVRDSLQLPPYRLATPPEKDIIAGVLGWMKAKDLIKGDYQYIDLVDESFLR